MCLDQLSGASAPEKQQQLAMLQAATLHLGIALKLYCRELASLLGSQEPERVYEISDLDVDPFRQIGCVQELTQHSGCRQLHDAERTILNPVVKASGPMIAGHVEVELTKGLVRQWLEQLRELSERHRQGLVEY
jgi:hypothetical protein